MLSQLDTTTPTKLEEKQTIDINLSYNEKKATSSQGTAVYNGNLTITFPSQEDAILFYDYITKRSPDSLKNIHVDKTTGKITLTTFSKNKKEFNVDLKSYEAVLHLIAGLGLNNLKMILNDYKVPDKEIVQITEAYETAGITHYRAISPYALPAEEKLSFSEYFQQTKVYFNKEKFFTGLGLDLDLTLTIPATQKLLSLPEPIPYSTPPSILYSVIDAPSTGFFSSLFPKEPSRYAAPNVKLQLTSSGALAVEFPSNEMATLALSMLGKAQVSDVFLTTFVTKQLPDAKGFIPFLNPDNPKQLLIPIDESDKDNPSLVLGNQTMHRTFLSFLNPHHDQKHTGDDAYEFPLTLDKKSSVCIRQKEFDQLKSNKILRIFLSNQSLLTPPELFINYLQVADKMKLNTSVREVFNNYLKFVKINNIDLEKEAEKTISLLPTRAKELINNFLTLKQIQQPYLFGTMSLNEYIARLLYNRPAAFYGVSDRYLLWDGTRGTQTDFNSLDPASYLQYDEIPFSALLILWSKTHFINDGRIENRGKIDPDDTYAKEGIVGSIVGARLEKMDVCEYRHMFITKKQNTTKNGYGKDAKEGNHATQVNQLWANFYGLDSENLLSYEEALVDQKGHPERYLKLSNGNLFNLEICIKRFYTLIETYLRQLNQDAQEAKTTAYDEALSFGTGVWAPAEIKYIINAIFPMVYELVVKNNNFLHISDINIPFLKIEPQDLRCGSAKDGEEITDSSGHKISIHFANHSPQALLEEKHQGKLRKRSIAWDGNAQIGNELYAGLFQGSGDPVGATASLVPLYQNPRINKKLHAGMIKGDKIQFHGEEKNPNVESILKDREWQTLVGKKVIEGHKQKHKPINPSSTASVTTTITTCMTTSTTSSQATSTIATPAIQPEKSFSTSTTTPQTQKVIEPMENESAPEKIISLKR